MAVRDSLFENPLFGTQTKTNMQKRLAELSGVVIAALGVALFVILFSYSAVDPNLFNETTGPVDNRFGRTGATIATALFLVIGWAAWALPTLCVAWGVRFFSGRTSSASLARLGLAVFHLDTLRASGNLSCAELLAGKLADGWVIG